MAMSAEEARDDSCCGSSPGDSDDNLPKYPWGLSISLNDSSLAKLGLTQLPDVGTAMTLTARVEVCSTSQYQERNGKTDRTLSLQITAMDLDSASESAATDPATTLYGE